MAEAAPPAAKPAGLVWSFFEPESVPAMVTVEGRPVCVTRMPRAFRPPPGAPKGKKHLTMEDAKATGVTMDWVSEGVYHNEPKDTVQWLQASVTGSLTEPQKQLADNIRKHMDRMAGKAGVPTASRKRPRLPDAPAEAEPAREQAGGRVALPAGAPAPKWRLNEDIPPGSRAEAVAKTLAELSPEAWEDFLATKLDAGLQPERRAALKRAMVPARMLRMAEFMRGSPEAALLPLTQCRVWEALSGGSGTPSEVAARSMRLLNLDPASDANKIGADEVIVWIMAAVAEVVAEFEAAS